MTRRPREVTAEQFAREALDQDSRNTGSIDDRVEALADVSHQLFAAGELAAAEMLAPRLQYLVDESGDSLRSLWGLNYLGLLRSTAGDGPGATELFERMRELAVSAQDADALGTALLNLGNQASRRGEVDRAEDSYRQSLKIREEQGDWRGQAQVRVNLAGIYEASGDLGRAGAEIALAVSVIGKHREPHLRASASGVRGRLAVAAGEFEAADAWFRKSLKYSRRSADLVFELISLQNLVAISVERGRLRSAARWADVGIRLSRRIGSTRHEEPFQRALGGILFREGDKNGSEEHLLIAGALAHFHGDALAEASALADVGALRAERGDYQQALKPLNRARRIFTILGDDEWLTPVLQNLRETHASLGDSGRARSILKTEIGRVKDPVRAAELHERTGDLLLQDGHLRSAALSFRKTIGILRDVGAPEWQQTAVVLADRLDEAGLYMAALDFYDMAISGLEGDSRHELEYKFRNDRAITLARTGRLLRATRELQQIAGSAAALDNRVIRADALFNLGEVLRRRRRVLPAREALEQALGLSRDLADAMLEGEVSVGLGLVLVDSEDWEVAGQHFHGARERAMEVQSRSLEARALAGLARCDAATGRQRSAVRRFTKAADLLSATGESEQLIWTIRYLAESLVALGRYGEVEPAIQRLVDVAQATRREPIASESIVHVAGFVADSNRTLAADLFSTAIVLAAASTRREVVDAVARATVFMYRTLDKHPRSRDQLVRMIERRLQKELGDAYQMLQPVLTAASKASARESNPNDG